jgi:hypothetical protein
MTEGGCFCQNAWGNSHIAIKGQHGEDDGHRAVLGAFLPAVRMLISPQVGIAQNLGGLRAWDVHDQRALSAKSRSAASDSGGGSVFSRAARSSSGTSCARYTRRSRVIRRA